MSTSAPSGLRHDLLSKLEKDVSVCLKCSPAIKLEAIRTVSKTFQLACATTSQKLTEEEAATFNSQIRGFVSMLSSFRTLQTTSTEYEPNSYRLYNDLELTDCAFHEVVHQNWSALSAAAAKQQEQHKHTMLPLLKACVEDEKQRIDQRSLQLARRKNPKNIPVLQETIAGLPNLSKDISAMLSPLLPTEEETKEKEQVAKQIISILQANKSKPLHYDMFGSSASGLGFANADLDLALYTKDFSPQELQLVTEQSLEGDAAFTEGAETKSKQDFINKLDNAGLVVLRIADLLRASGQFHQVETVSSARVPVVRMIHTSTQTHCDIAIGDHNELAVLNTRLMRCYGELDSTVKEFILMVKLWAKRRKVGDASEGFISSYGWTLLSLYYLQQNKYIPNLQVCKSDDNLVVDRKVNGFHVRFSSKSSEEECNKAKDVNELFRGFFAYYSTTFRYKQDFIHFYPVRNATRSQDAPSWRMSIIDPFELTHDLGTTLSGRRAQVVINHELANAHDLLSTPTTTTLEQILTEMPILSNIGGRVCNVCGEPGHRSRGCVNLEANKRTITVDRCFKCGQLGHVSKNCRVQVKQTRLGVFPSQKRGGAPPPKLDLTKPLAPAKVTRLGDTPSSTTPPNESITSALKGKQSAKKAPTAAARSVVTVAVGGDAQKRQMSTAGKQKREMTTQAAVAPLPVPPAVNKHQMSTQAAPLSLPPAAAVKPRKQQQQLVKEEAVAAVDKPPKKKHYYYKKANNKE